MKQKVILVLLGWLALSELGYAELIVIRDYGGRLSGVPRLDQVKIPAIRRPPIGILKVYPVQSELQSGYLEKPLVLATPQPRARPFFIVGDDEFSRDWIEKNKQYLVDIHAQGIATNIESETDFQALKKWAHPLPLLTLPVDEIAEALEIPVYPVLITGEEIAQ